MSSRTPIEDVIRDIENLGHTRSDAAAYVSDYLSTLTTGDRAARVLFGLTPEDVQGISGSLFDCDLGL